MMKTKNLIATLLVGTSLLAAPVFAKDSPEDTINAAKEAQKKADSVGGEWRDVGKFIKEAEEALKAGDNEKAMKLAKKALAQSENGYKQAIEQAEKTAKGFPDYMK